MNDYKHTVLCVDDDERVLNTLKRLLRKENYRLLTASCGEDGLKLLEKNEVHLIISDNRMPHMSGTEFLSIARERHPEAIRIALTGYTGIDSITESINKGNVYKFFLKPWNDQSLKIEIKNALDQYDLIQANRELNQKILEQNTELKMINENLEHLVRERTKDLEIQNRALELSRAILEDLPVPIVSVSAEGMIVLRNNRAKTLQFEDHNIEVGLPYSDLFPKELQECLSRVLLSNAHETVTGCRLSNGVYNIHIQPLTGKFKSKGALLCFVSC